MSIKIEVSGDSIGEVADKLLALGGMLAVAMNTTAAPVEAPGEPEKPKRSRKTATSAEEQAGFTQTQTAVPAPAVTASAEASTVQSSEPETPNSAPEQTPTGEATAQPDAKPLDFDKDVTPAVLNAVETHGRDKVAELLGQFGVARAGQLDEARWPELLQALSDI